MLDNKYYRLSASSTTPPWRAMTFLARLTSLVVPFTTTKYLFTSLRALMSALGRAMLAPVSPEIRLIPTAPTIAPRIGAKE